MIEVLAELAGGDLGFDVAAGRGDDAHVDLHLVGAADALEGLLDQHAQDLVLGLARHVGDLVDEQRAAMRLLERADLAPSCPSTGASTPNSSISMRSGIIAAALMTTNGPLTRAEWPWMVRAASSLPAPAGPTIRMRLLVGATFSTVWRSWLIDDDLPTKVEGDELLERLDLALEPRGFERALRHQHQPVGLERLLDEVVGALLDGGDRGLDVAVTGDHHHRQLRMLLLQRVEQLQPVEPAALQPDVEEHQVRPPARDVRERVVAVARGARHDSLRPAGCRTTSSRMSASSSTMRMSMPWAHAFVAS